MAKYLSRKQHIWGKHVCVFLLENYQIKKEFRSIIVHEILCIKSNKISINQDEIIQCRSECSESCYLHIAGQNP